jgi:uncharacterized protein (DUF697 family)
MPSALGGVFGSTKLLYGAMRDMRDGDRQPLMLCGRKEQLDALMAALGAGAGAGPDAAAQLFAVRRLRGEDTRRLARASVAVYGGTIVSGLDEDTRADLEVFGRVATRKLALLEALDLPSPGVTAAGRVRGLQPGMIVPYRRGRFPTRRVLEELADRCGGSGPWLASQLPGLRPYVIENVIEAAARRNAKAALMIFIPGADFPVLTAVQMRMVLAIANAHGQPITTDRAVELLSVLGAGFGFRMMARQLLDVIPIAGWAIQSTIAYSATRAIGTAANEYFEHGAVADASRLRALAEGIKIEVEQRLRRRAG